MSWSWSSDSRPMWNPHAHLIHGEREALIHTRSATYTISGDGRALVVKLRFELDGTRTVAEIAQRTGVSTRSIADLLATMGRDAVEDVAPALEAQALDAFFDAYYSTCDAWALEIFAVPFWQRLFAGHSQIAEIFGWGLEFYHRTEGADEHNALALGQAADDEIRRWLAQHVEEEFGHGGLFRAGLTSVGYDDAWVRASRPLPTTGALINFMSGLACSDSTSYLGCYGVLHSPHVGQTLDGISSQFELFSVHYPEARPLFEAMKIHASLDLDLGHDDLFLERYAQLRGNLSDFERLKVLRAAFGMTRAFNGFFEGISTYYRGSAAFDRLPNHLESVRR